MLKQLFNFILKNSIWILNEKAGGGDTTIQSAPTTPTQNAGESAAQVAEAKLKYDPLTAASDWAIQQQYVPKQADLYTSLYNQYANQTAKSQLATQQELFPTQSKLLEAGATDTLSRLQNPNYMTPQEQAALDADRAKSMFLLQQSMRNRANMGGTLYGGRSAQQENEGMGNMLNQFAIQDYTNRQNNSAQTQSDLTKYLQILYPQIGTQNQQVSPYQYSSAVASPDTIYNAMYQASQPQQMATQGTDNTGAYAGLAGSGLIALAMM